MRCPKCGFHSFDYLDNCKKCGVDLTELKLRFKFQGYVAPAPAAEPAATSPAPVAASPQTAEEVPEFPAMAEAESEAIDFGFDVLEEASAPVLPPLEYDAATPATGGDDFADLDSAAEDQAADSGLIFGQPFGEDSESAPGDGLPKLDKRFDF